MLPKANRYTPHLFEVLQADIEQDLKKKKPFNFNNKKHSTLNNGEIEQTQNLNNKNAILMLIILTRSTIYRNRNKTEANSVC